MNELDKNFDDVQAHADETTREIADVVRDHVAEIEASVPTTRNHYGDYMILLVQLADDLSHRKILAEALIKFGANKQGVVDALEAVT